MQIKKELLSQSFIMSNYNQANKLVLGSAQFGMPYGIANSTGQISQDEVSKILNFASKNNINTIDTAKNYGNSEISIGKYLKKSSNSKWSIITKISQDRGIYDQITDSIEKLSVLPNVVMAHNAELYVSKKFQIELEQVFEKHTFKIGVSIYTENDIDKVLNAGLKPDIIQVPINILDSRLYRKDIISKLYQNNIEIHARSVFLQGLFYLPLNELDERFVDAIPFLEKLHKIAKKYNVKLSELSLLWLASLKEISKIIIGVDSLSHLQMHLVTISKKLENRAFDEALSIHYENKELLNPLTWL